MKGMSKSRIGYTNELVPWYYAVNFGGFGCSGGCPGCWSRGMCHRAKCEKCRAFEVHLHPERLGQPKNTKKPGVVLCNFTCDTFDKKRPGWEIRAVLRAMDAAPWHNYVLLTQQPDNMAPSDVEPTNRWAGLTIRNQDDADNGLDTFSCIDGNLWLSLEPLQEDVRMKGWLRATKFRGAIIGHDNRKGAPGTETLEHVRSVVQQCRAAGVNVYVKQIFLWQCPKCGATDDSTMVETGCVSCGAHECNLGTLKQKLCKDVADFPPDLQYRNLPWSMPEAARPQEARHD